MNNQESCENTALPVDAEFLRRQLSLAFERIWETVVRFPLEKSETRLESRDDLPWYGAVAWIGGTWTGNVRIGLCPQLASQVTAALLETCNPGPDQIKDALRELANMTAGNLKSVLPGRCGLATPGNFNVTSLAHVDDDFHSVMISWYLSAGCGMFLAMSELHRA